MQAVRVLAAGVLVLGLIGGPAPGREATVSAQASNPQGWRGVVQQGGAIEIKGVNGGIKAMPSSGGEVEVSAVMKGRRNNPAEVRLDIVQHADGITICAMYPSQDSRPNECAPGEGGRMNVRNNDVTVEFTVRVPAGVRFIGHTVNGDVTADGLAGPVSVQTVNGEANFSTSSYGDASTVNGSIRGSMGSTQWSQTLRFRSVNGSIALNLPADASTDVQAATVNGSITTDFPLTVTGKISPRRLTGTIGGGGRSMDLETVNGSVTLRRQ